MPLLIDNTEYTTISGYLAHLIEARNILTGQVWQNYEEHSQLINYSSGILRNDYSKIISGQVISLSGFTEGINSGYLQYIKTGFVSNLDTGNFCTRNNVESTGSQIIGLINGLGAGVLSLNTKVGIITLEGAGNIGITAPIGQTIIISGDTGEYRNFATNTNLIITGNNLNNKINLLSGHINNSLVKGSVIYRNITNQITGIKYDNDFSRIYRNNIDKITGIYYNTYYKKILYDGNNSVTGVNVIYY